MRATRAPSGATAIASKVAVSPALRSLVEILSNPDRDALRPDRQRHRALDRAAAGFGDVDDQLGLQRPGGRPIRQVDRKIGMALIVGLDLVGELGFDGGEVVVGEAADVPRIACERRAHDRLQPDGAGDVEPASRRAVQEPRVERELDRLAGNNDRTGWMQGEIEPLGNIVLEQEIDLADAVALRVGVGLDRPLARCGARQQRDGQSASAKPLVGQGRAPVFDPVRPLDDQRQRQARPGYAFGVAQQRDDVYGLAGAIDAAFGVEECVEPLRRVAAGYAAVGKVESVLSEVEEAVVVAAGRNQQARRRAALAARKPGVEIDPAVGVCCLRRQHFVVARDELEFDAGERRGGAERLHDRM